MTPSKAQPDATDRGPLKRTAVGVVKSDKRDRTRTVVIEYLSKDEKYGKYIRSWTSIHVHDENNESRAGDLVEIIECRPLSKTKSWRLSKIVEQRSRTRVQDVVTGDPAAENAGKES